MTSPERSLTSPRAITLAPKFWRTWANKGLVLCQVNRRKEGIRALQQALELAPAEVKPRLAAQIEQLQSDR